MYIYKKKGILVDLLPCAMNAGYCGGSASSTELLAAGSEAQCASMTNSSSLGKAVNKLWMTKTIYLQNEKSHGQRFPWQKGYSN